MDNGNKTFKKFKSSLNRGISTISTMTSNTIEKSKINTEIDSLEKEIEKIFAAIGKKTYSSWESDRLNFQEFSEEFQIVNQSKEKIEELINKLKAVDEGDKE